MDAEKKDFLEQREERNDSFIERLETVHDTYIGKYCPLLGKLSEMINGESDFIVGQLLCNRLIRMAGEISQAINEQIKY